ncbi:protein mono-ADP-ribosyltransferase PARP14-like [Haliotis cracherodii]|uniref:protein mono-ADP-ribosyltransferase PARP14-like n=1 Tax=Haliotis cracherodii TaxID=6455 RepID=UPI0039E79686
MEDRIDQRCVIVRGFSTTPNPHQDIHRLPYNLAGIQIKKICQLHTLSTTNTPDWCVLCQNVEDANAIKVFTNYQGCQLTVSPCGAEDVPQEWRTPASEPEGTMHSLRSNNAFGSSPGDYQHGQDILEEPPMSGFESMNYNIDNPEAGGRGGITGTFVSLNRVYPNTSGIEHLSDGFAQRQPLHPGYRPTHPPGMPFYAESPAFQGVPWPPPWNHYPVNPNQGYYWPPYYQYPHGSIPRFPGQPPAPVPLFQNQPNIGSGLPQPTRYTQPLSSITVDHPVSSVPMPRPQEMHDSPELPMQRTVPVHHLEYPDADELVFARRTIEVHGCDFASGSLDKFKYYFENERRGGGDVEHFENDEENNMLLITFKDPAVAQRLVKKGRVTIAKEEAEIRPHTPTPVYVDKVLLKYPGAHLDKDSEDLSIYLQARANADVKGVNKGAKDGVLLVTFSDPIDISKLQSACNNKPFKTKAVTVFKVPATRVLRVEGVPLSVASETISDYFETRKCGNDTSSEVVKVEGLDQRGCYLVHLADHKVVEQISERVHTLGEANIKVYLHHKCVGWQSPESNDTTPAQMSGAIPLEGVDQLVPRFLKKSPKVLRNIQEKLGGYGLSLKLNESNQLFVFRQVGSECGTTTADGMDYKSSARSVISEFVLHLLVQIPMEVKGNIDTMLMQVNVDETEVRMYTDKEVVAIVGIPTKANEVKAEVEKHIAHGISSKGPPNPEIVKPLAPLKAKFLRECGFKEIIKQFPGVSARFDANDVHLSGPETSVKEATIKMYELVNGTQTSEIEHVSKQQLTELQKKAVEDGLRNKLKEIGIVAAWRAKESSLEVISTTPEKVGQVGEMILNTVVERVVPLEGKMQLLMQSESWESLRKSLIDHLPDTFSIHNLQDKNYLLIVGIKDDVECVYAEVKMFLSSNTVDETRLSFTKGQHRFLLAHYKEEVATIAKDLKDYHVRIIYQENGTEFTINGSKEGIDKCRKKLTFLADKVITHKELSQKAGMARMLKTGQGGHIISHVEKVERCIIEVVNEEKGEEEDKHVGQGNAATQEPVSTIVAVSNIAGGRKIYVREGDITTMKVSAIVNAANERLDHCGGLAKVIVDKAGKDVQDECTRHVNSYGAVLDGDAVLSKPGRLKGSCDFIVHAVGPRWEGGKKKEKEKLREAVTRSLELTDNRLGSSIAIPALSAGIFGYPKDAATKVITTAVRDYFVKHKSSTIKDVYFCTVNGKTVDSFVNSLQDVLGASNVHIQPRLQGGTGAQMQQSSPRTQRRVSALSDVKCGYKIKLVEGSIAEQKVDVIVNTTNKELNLQNAGPVSTAILEAAGPELLSACRIYPQGINPGSIVVTPGFKLKCKKVYHVCMKTSTPLRMPFLRQHTQNTTVKKKSLLQAVADIVKECLTTADRHNCSSIAMPALGTGIGGYSRDVVAEAMLSTIHDFWSQCPNTSLTDIRVILYPRDRENIQVFKDQAQQMKTGGQRTSDSGRRVILSRGSITRFKADVIVNPTDRELNLSRGRLSKAISDAAGPALEAECRRKYPNGTYSLAVTSAGLLQASEIYHVVIPPWNRARGEENLHRAVTLCLEEADKSRLTSLLFPTLGIGLSGYDKDVSARIMFTAIDDFWRNHPDTTLIDIKIVIYDKDNDVAKVFEKQCGSFHGIPTSSRRGRQLKTDHKSTEEPFDVSGGITFGNIHFTLKHGDLLKENVDCIMNSVDSQFNLKKGTINQVLLRKYPAVGTDNRTQKEKDLRSKGLTVSQIAGATFNTVIHYDPFHFSHGVKAILKACIKQADKMHCSSVALPALGQGPFGGVPEHLLMDYLYDELQDLSNLKYVTEVRLVLYEPDRYNRFNDLLASLLNRRGIAKKPFFGDKNKGHGGARPKTQPGKCQTESRRQHVAEHLPADGVEVEFFSDSKTCIQSAKQKLENACIKEFDDQPVEHDTIRTLDEEKILRLQSIARQRGVSIDINTRLGRIRLQGLKEDVAAMSKSVYELCLEQKDEEHAEAVGACVQWYYMDVLNNGDEELVAYDQNTNKLIEKTFRGNEETHELEDTEGVKYIIDFKDMVEYREDDKSTKVIVVRKDLIQAAEFDPPHHWETMGASENLNVCRMSPDNAEYRSVAGSFSSANRTIIKIERVQNKSLYKQYMAKKEEFRGRHSTIKQERQLWHGTATAAIPSINSYGFNRSYCGKNAVAYGNGVYFAVNVNYSTQDRYSRPDPAGNKYIYLVDVLTGEYTLGKSGMRVPPPVDPATPAVIYDSVVENIHTPGMFVIFNDTQAYPKYLITYK